MVYIHGGWEPDLTYVNRLNEVVGLGIKWNSEARYNEDVESSVCRCTEDQLAVIKYKLNELAIAYEVGQSDGGISPVRVKNSQIDRNKYENILRQLAIRKESEAAEEKKSGGREEKKI